MSNIIFDVPKTNEIITKFNQKYNEIDELLNNLETEYNKLSDDVWFSNEKIKLDEILKPYITKSRKYPNNSKTIVNALQVYCNDYATFNNITNKKMG